MGMLNWTKSLEVGNITIDGQHEKLVDLLNQLYDAMRHQQSKTEITPILKELKDYTVDHFEAEQKLFMASDYPLVDEHLAMHKEFVDKLAGWEKESAEGKLMLSVDVLNFLTDWLLNHIRQTDKKMAAYL